MLDRIVASVRGGESRALVLHGDQGAGKTALLEYLAGHADGCRVARAAGVQIRDGAGVRHPCISCALRCWITWERLPAPQRDALQTAFGMTEGPAPDRFLVALAALTLLSESAAERPLLCLVDDHQWSDHASAQVLAFVARRLSVESVGLLFAARRPGGDLSGLDELAIGGLDEADARALLDSVVTGPLDERVRDQIVAETRGNPLALMELPRSLTPGELAGGFGLPGAPAGTDPRRGELPAPGRGPSRRDPPSAAARGGRPGRATRHWSGGRPPCSGSAQRRRGPRAEAGLAEFGARVRFRHPLVRSVVYRFAPGQDRQRAHAALAEVTDPRLNPDRRAWHRAQAAAGPDEGIARELESSASRAKARGGLAAAAAFLERAAMLSLDPAQRAGRALAAADGKALGRGVRSGAGPARHGGSRAADRVPARSRGPASRPDRVSHQPGQRRAAPAAEGRQEARAHRRRAFPCEGSGCAVGGDVREPPGRCWCRHAGDRAVGRLGAPAAATPHGCKISFWTD